MVNVKIRLIVFFAANDGEALYSQQEQDQVLTVAWIMKPLLPNSGDSLKEAWGKQMGSKDGRQRAEERCDSRLYRTHFDMEAALKMYLSDEQIEKVKDVMTFNVVKVTYEAQCDMIPTLKDEEKRQIMAWLKEARELAIDAESSKKKHEVFGKYKGRINNYLARQGYDLTREREAWYERVKARGGRL